MSEDGNREGGAGGESDTEGLAEGRVNTASVALQVRSCMRLVYASAKGSRDLVRAAWKNRLVSVSTSCISCSVADTPSL
jgi:hypothetical protein